MTDKSLPWNDDERKQVAMQAREIYAENFVHGAPISKLQAYREAVSVLPADRQKEIKGLANISHWATKYWPASTDPVEEIERFKAELAAKAERRVRTDSDAPPAEADLPEIPDSVVAPLVELEARRAAEDKPAEPESFWTRPEAPKVAEQAPLFDEAAMAARVQENAREAAANVPVSFKARPKRMQMVESPEALITRGLTGLLNERIAATIDRRTTAILENKTKLFIEDALKVQLAAFHDEMTTLVASLEESMNNTVKTFQVQLAETLRGLPQGILPAQPANVVVPPAESQQAPTEAVAEPAQRGYPQSRSEISTTPPVDAQAQGTSTTLTRRQIGKSKPMVLIAGIHPRIADQVRREWKDHFALEIWTGPANDRRDVSMLMDSFGVAGVIVGNTCGGLEIYDALKKHPTLPYIKVNGSASGVSNPLHQMFRNGEFPKQQ